MTSTRKIKRHTVAWARYGLRRARRATIDAGVPVEHLVLVYTLTAIVMAVVVVVASSREYRLTGDSGQIYLARIALFATLGLVLVPSLIRYYFLVSSLPFDTWIWQVEYLAKSLFIPAILFYTHSALRLSHRRLLNITTLILGGLLLLVYPGIFFVSVLAYGFVDYLAVAAIAYTAILHIVFADHGEQLTRRSRRALGIVLCATIPAIVVVDVYGLWVGGEHFEIFLGPVIVPAMVIFWSMLLLVDDARRGQRRVAGLDTESYLASLAARYHLSAREIEVAERILAGQSYGEIGDELCISLATVKTHSLHIYQKTDSRNKIDLVNKALAQREPPSAGQPTNQPFG